MPPEQRGRCSRSVTLVNSDAHLCPFVWSVVKNLPEMQETWVRSLGQEDPLEKEMATHSSTLAWEIPWMEEPDRLVHGITKSRT